MDSSTKPIAAAAVLMMMEGKLRLEDPVSRYLPEFKGARVAVRKRGDTGRFVLRPAGASHPDRAAASPWRARMATRCMRRV